MIIVLSDATLWTVLYGMYVQSMVNSNKNCLPLRYYLRITLMEHHWWNKNWLRTWEMFSFADADNFNQMWRRIVGGWRLGWMAIGFKEYMWWLWGTDENWRLRRAWWRWISEILAYDEWMTGLFESKITLLMWLFGAYRHCWRLFFLKHVFALSLLTLSWV